MPFILAPVASAGTADWVRAVPVAPAKISERQRQIYDFVYRYQQLWGETPLYREIAGACGLRGVSAVRYQVRQLVRLGLARKPPKLVRAILLTAVPVKAG